MKEFMAKTKKKAVQNRKFPNQDGRYKSFPTSATLILFREKAPDPRVRLKYPPRPQRLRKTTLEEQGDQLHSDHIVSHQTGTVLHPEPPTPPQACSSSSGKRGP